MLRTLMSMVERRRLTRAGQAAASRECTCHPDDHPPTPCPHRYAYSECVKAADMGDVQTRYDDLMREGKHGHYETLFQVVREDRARFTKAVEVCRLMADAYDIVSDLPDDSDTAMANAKIADALSKAPYAISHLEAKQSMAPWNDPTVRWVCEQHPDKDFPHDDCAGPGMPEGGR